MRGVSTVALLFLLCSLALLFAAPAVGWAAPTIVEYKIQHATLLRSPYPGGEASLCWAPLIGVHLSDAENADGVTVYGPDNAPHPGHPVCAPDEGHLWYCANWKQAWEDSAPPVTGQYSLVVHLKDGTDLDPVVTQPATHFPEPVPEITYPSPGAVIEETVPLFTWLPYPGFACEGYAPAEWQSVEVYGPLDPTRLWGIGLPPAATSILYGTGSEPPPPLQPGQGYTVLLWEVSPPIPLEGYPPGWLVESTRRDLTFAVYSPLPAIQSADICRARCLCPDPGRTEFYHEGARISVLDFDGWQDVSVTTQTPDGLVLPDPVGCDSSTNDGRYRLNQANAHNPPALGAGSYTVTATDTVGATVSIVSGPASEMPPMHEIIYPTDGSVLPETETAPTFSWSGAPGAAFFCVCVKDRNAADAVLWVRRFIPGETTSVVYNDDGSATVPELSPGGRYMVHVRAHYPDEDPGDGVAVDTFTGRSARFRVYSPGPASPVLYDFENANEVSQWWSYANVPVGLSQANEHATNGNHSLQIDLPAADPGTSGLATCWDGNVGNWSSYNTLVLDFYNPNPQSLQLALMLHDEPCWSSTEALSWTKVTLHPGANQVRLNLTELLVYDSSRHLDLSHIYMLFIDCQTPLSETTTIYCDYIRLEQVPDDPLVDAARNIWKFDFGAADSPRWPDFFAVSEVDQYPVDPAAKPFGWTDDPAERPRFSGNDQGPDDLCRDYVRRNCPGACGPDDSMNFRVDVPNGDYVVYAIARWGHCCPLPAGPHQIWAENGLAVNMPMDAATFYTTDYFYRGLDEDYPLRQPAWDTFVQPNYPEYSFTTTVTDNSLDLAFVACRVYAVVVYPVAYADEMAARIAGVDEERRIQFDDAYFVLPPQELTSAADARRSGTRVRGLAGRGDGPLLSRYTPARVAACVRALHGGIAWRAPGSQLRHSPVRQFVRCVAWREQPD